MFVTKRTSFAGADSLHNHHFLQENRLAARPALIPGYNRTVDYEHKEESDRLMSLDGTWRFAYRKEDCIPGFYEEGADDSRWDEIPVPSMWQYMGYCGSKYTNVDYMFPFDPPYIDCENPVGYYRKAFDIDTALPRNRVILHFGGVDNAFFAYLNGTYIGFSKGSRLPAEFDVTDLVRDHGNILAVKVFTYSDATYLENQDMLMANGIFRSVYMTFHKKAMIYDADLLTDMHGMDFAAYVDEMIPGNYKVRVQLDGQVYVLAVAEGKCAVRFEVSHPKLWTAETPDRYRVEWELYDGEELLEKHHKYVGFTESKIEGYRLLVNGKPITVKGVNRHEHNCHTGRAITAEFIRKELTLIKNSNFNAVRCCHYTNNPCFYDICTELGLYVMDEADLETHGAQATGDQGFLSKNPDWEEAYMDRVTRMVACDHNESCINIWSIGNECGRGRNLNVAAHYLKSLPHPKPVHSAQRAEDSDFETTGYMTLAALDRFDAVWKDHTDPDAERYPVMVTEFAHAMGNGPGCLYDYWDHIYHSERVCGGYVWEFKSHGMYTTDASGRAWYRYGGDFPDDPNHWSNFTIDGYLTSDGTPKPVFRELAQCMAPAWLSLKEGKVSVLNTMDFTDLEGFIIRWTLSEDGRAVKQGEWILPSVPARTEAVLFDLPAYAKVPGARYTLETVQEKDGVVYGSRQLFVETVPAEKNWVPEKGIELTEEDGAVYVKGSGFVYCFRDGMPASLIMDGKVIMDRPARFCVYRAYTDNDGIVGVFPRHTGEWDNHMLPYMHFACHSKTAMIEDDGTVMVRAQGKLVTVGRYFGFRVDLSWKIDGKGVALFTCEVAPYGDQPTCLPRFGLVFDLPGAFRKVKWLGRGPEESYPDAKSNAPVGLYDMDVSQTYFRFDVPQECGSHENTVYTRVSGKEGAIAAVACGNMAFTTHDFSLEALQKARHCNELLPDGRTYLYVDYKMRGLGSLSCGPDPEECYEFRPHDFRFAFVLAPNADEKALLELSRTNFGVKSEALSGPYTKELRKERELLDCSEE